MMLVVLLWFYVSFILARPSPRSSIHSSRSYSSLPIPAARLFVAYIEAESPRPPATSAIPSSFSSSLACLDIVVVVARHLQRHSLLSIFMCGCGRFCCQSRCHFRFHRRRHRRHRLRSLSDVEKSRYQDGICVYRYAFK